MSKAPIAKRVPHTHNAHQHQRVDHYHWLRDDDRNDPEMLAYLRAENQFTEATMAKTAEFQAHLFEELKGRLKPDDASVPTRVRSYWYYTRYESGKEHPVYCRRLGSMDAPEQVILDVNELAKEHAYYNVADLVISEDEQRLAFTEDTVSRRIYTIRFKNLMTGQLLDDSVPNVDGGIAWAADNETIFYVRKDPKTLRPYLVRRHRLNEAPEKDVTVHEEQDESFYVSVRRSKSRRFVMIDMQSTLVSETLVVEASTPTEQFRAVLPRSPRIEYDVEHHKETFYIRTNRDAPNFKLMAAPIGTASDESTWREIVAHRDSVFLADFDVFRDFLVLGERRKAVRGIRIIRWDDQRSHDVTFDEAVHVAYTGANPEFDTHALRLVYSSLTTPNTVYDYDMVTRERRRLKQDQVLGGFQSQNYISERAWVRARDGEKIPVSIVTPKGFTRDGTHPFYVYAYGSYGYSMDPSFSASWISLLDRGFGVAIAHIRGGQEKGRAWYEDGKMFNKMNTFTDFIDVSDFLVNEQYTASDRLVAGGGSAGGLLMGVVANLRPELYRVIYSAVPFVDVVSTMLDDTIPLTTGEYDEWGNPNVEASYRYMLSYSPYDQVHSQAYPNMIVTTGLHDSQVQYWEPAKWVAKLRHLKTDDNTLLLDVDMDTGHGGAAGRYKRYRKTALVYAFMMYMIDSNLERWQP